MVREKDRSVSINWQYWDAFRAGQPPSFRGYLLEPEMDILIKDRTSLEREILFTTLWRTGGKISEVLALRANDFRLLKGGEMVYFGGVRNGRGVEIVDKRYLRLVGRFIDRYDRKPSEPLLRISRQTATNWLSRRLIVLRENDPHVLPDMRISFDTFRHSFAFHALLHVVPLDTLQRWLGHNQAQMTRRYMQYLGFDYRQQMQRMSH